MNNEQVYAVITFHTTTEAMAAEKKCTQNHIPGALIPIPGALSAGCGLAWRMTSEEYESYKEVMAHSGMRYEQISMLPPKSEG